MCPGVLKPVHKELFVLTVKNKDCFCRMYIYFGETEDIVSRGHF